MFPGLDDGHMTRLGCLGFSSQLCHLLADFGKTLLCCVPYFHIVRMSSMILTLSLEFTEDQTYSYEQT